MKRQVGKIILLSVLNILLFAFEGFAQSKLQYEINSGFVYSGRNGNLLSNWGRGWTLGAGMSYGLTPVIKIVARASYQRYHYTGGYLFLNVPDEEGFRREIDGEATNIYELSFGARFVNQRNFVKFYLTLGGGLLFTDIGKIIREIWFEDNPGKRHFFVHPGTGTLVKEGSASLGFGFIAPINSKLRLIFEFKFIGTLKTNADLIPITLAIQF